jgi:UDP-glucose 4-epimerase
VDILVTGGFGFIGSHLVELLLQDAATSVHVVDDLSTSPLPLDELLDELGHPPRLSYDISNVVEYLARPDVQTFDQVYHLASPVGPAGVLEHAGYMVRQIVDDTYAVIAYALHSGARLLDVSTSEVYGGGQEGFCAEGAPKIVPARTTVRLEYAVAKLAGETALINMTKVTGLDAVIVRPFNVAGPRQSPKGGFVLPRFLHQAHFGDDLTVFGDGRALRAFTHVRDVVAGLVCTMGNGKRGEAYNIGNPANRISILELAERVCQLVPGSSAIRFVDPKEIYGQLYEEANDKFPDATRAMNELGWRPTSSVDETIEDAYAYFKSLLRRHLVHRDG